MQPFVKEVNAGCMATNEGTTLPFKDKRTIKRVDNPLQTESMRSSKKSTRLQTSFYPTC